MDSDAAPRSPVSPTPAEAFVVSIGDELTLGQSVDTNSAWLSARFAEVGLWVSGHVTVDDVRDRIVDALRFAATRARLIVLTGGLGPTEDDLTRQALATWMGRDLVLDDQQLEAIRQRMESRGRTMPPRNRIQAMAPSGARMIPNGCGTAPGIDAAVDCDEAGRVRRVIDPGSVGWADGTIRLFALPGPPREMKPMFEAAVGPVARQLGGGRCILSASLHCFGMGESAVADCLGDLAERSRNPTIGTTVSQSIVTVRLRSAADSTDDAASMLQRDLAVVHQRVGPLIYGEAEQSLAEVVLELLAARGETIALAESCTGGLIGEMLTRVPGSSATFQGGWVVYSNAMKQRELGVPGEMLERDGAVSSGVAEAMAVAAREKAGATWGVGVTGVAGPTGGTAEKPVGTVWIAVARDRADAAGRGTLVVESRRFQLGDERDLVRDRSAKAALQMLRLMAIDADVDALQWAAPAASGSRGAGP